MFKKKTPTPYQHTYTWGEANVPTMLSEIRKDNVETHDRIVYNIHREYDISIPGTAEAVLVKLAAVHDMEFLDAPPLDESLLVNATDIVTYLHLVKDGKIKDNQNIKNSIIRRTKREKETLPLIYVPECEHLSYLFQSSLGRYRVENYDEFKVGPEGRKKPSFIVDTIADGGIPTLLLWSVIFISIFGMLVQIFK